MSVLLLPPAAEHHAGAEEGDAVEVGEDDGEARVQTEQLHRPELGDGANTERQGVWKNKMKAKLMKRPTSRQRLKKKKRPLSSPSSVR